MHIAHRWQTVRHLRPSGAVVAEEPFILQHIRQVIGKRPELESQQAHARQVVVASMQDSLMLEL